MNVRHIHKPHNKTLFIYHPVCPAKYRRDVFTKEVSHTLKTVCLEFGPAYDINFLEIGIDEDHVHFLFQTIPSIRFSETVKKIKSITARHIFKTHPEVKHKLWGGNFWTQGYYANTVGQYGNLNMITNYVKNRASYTTNNCTTKLCCLSDTPPACSGVVHSKRLFDYFCSFAVRNDSLGTIETPI